MNACGWHEREPPNDEGICNQIYRMSQDKMGHFPPSSSANLHRYNSVTSGLADASPKPGKRRGQVYLELDSSHQPEQCFSIQLLIDIIIWLTELVVVFRCRCIIRAKAAASETGADAERRRAGEGDAQWHCANPTRSWNRRRLWSGSVRNWGWQLTIWLFYHYACAVIVMPCSSFSDGRLGPLCISVILCCC